AGAGKASEAVGRARNLPIRWGGACRSLGTVRTPGSSMRCRGTLVRLRIEEDRRSCAWSVPALPRYQTISDKLPLIVIRMASERGSASELQYDGAHFPSAPTE